MELRDANTLLRVRTCSVTLNENHYQNVIKSFYLLQSHQAGKYSYIEKVFQADEWIESKSGSRKSLEMLPFIVMSAEVNAHLLPDILSGFPTHMVVNQKVIDIIQEFEPQVQLGEVRYVEEFQYLSEYKILNPLSVVDAMDYDR